MPITELLIAGIYQGVLAEEEVCIASSSRNFPEPDGTQGRFGVPGLARHRRRQRADRTHHRPA